KQAAQAETQKLPDAEQAYRESQTRVQAAREKVIQAEQALQLEGTHHTHAQKTLQSLEARQQRLQSEQRGLTLPNAQELDNKKTQIETLRSELEQKQAQQESTQQQLSPLTNQVKTVSETVQIQARDLATIEARLQALVQLQENVQAAKKI